MTVALLADRRWLRSPSRFLYGAVVTGSVIAVAAETTASVGRIALDTAVILFVYWASHVYAEVLASGLIDPDAAPRERVHHALTHEVSIVVGGVPALIVLEVCGLLGMRVGRAANVALLATIVLLGCAGYTIGRASGASRWGIVANVAGAAAMGILIVLLKALALH